VQPDRLFFLCLSAIASLRVVLISSPDELAGYDHIWGATLVSQRNPASCHAPGFFANFVLLICTKIGRQ
jgi:hypothetical protein